MARPTPQLPLVTTPASTAWILSAPRYTPVPTVSRPVQTIWFPALPRQAPKLPTVSSPARTIWISAGHVRCLPHGDPAQVSIVPDVNHPDKPAESDTPWRSGQPTLWYNSFTQTWNDNDPPEEGSTARKLEELKGIVRDWISDTNGGAAEKLELYDALRRLGVAYHFEREMEMNLKAMSSNLTDVLRELTGSLLHTALLFRLLRENGFTAQQDAFDKFRDESGGFKISLNDDVEGILSLYEASFLAFPGEEVLEKAKAFAVQGLEEFLLRTATSEGVDAAGCDITRLRERVEYALNMPLHWRMPRLYTRWFINVYERDERANPMLLELAMLDFNVVQRAHRRDCKETFRWWKDLGLYKKLHFARDRLLELFYPILGTVFEPQFWLCRRGITKINALVSAIDEVYDLYGSLDELESFTMAVERWDVEAMEELPEYMRAGFQAVRKTTNEFADQCLQRNGFDCEPYLKKSWIDLCKSYLVEARWSQNKHIPSFDEYLKNAWVSVASPIAFTHAYFLVSENVTEEALNAITDDECCDLLPQISMIIRLSNDLGTSATEMERGDASSSIKCYMLESSVPEEVAREKIIALIGDAWKQLNRVLQSNIKHLPTPFVKAALNGVRTSQLLYGHRDKFGALGTGAKDMLNLLLIEPTGDDRGVAAVDSLFRG